MTSRFRDIFKSTLNFGGDGFTKIRYAVNNFIDAFNEIAHNKKIEIFVCDSSKRITNVKINRLQKLDEFPLPTDRYRPAEINCFNFILEKWDQSNYSALIIGSTLTSPMLNSIDDLNHDQSIREVNLFRLCNDDPPSKRELHNYFMESHVEGQKIIASKLGDRQKEFTDHLTNIVLPKWRGAPISENWKNLKKNSPLEVNVKW